MWIEQPSAINKAVNVISPLPRVLKRSCLLLVITYKDGCRKRPWIRLTITFKIGWGWEERGWGRPLLSCKRNHLQVNFLDTLAGKCSNGFPLSVDAVTSPGRLAADGNHWGAGS